MSLLSVVQDVCVFVGVERPDAVIANLASDRTMQEMLALATEMAQRMAADTRDWQKLKKQQTFAGDGTTTAFTLPSNYQRMPVSSNVWRSSQTAAPMRFIVNSDEWMRRRNAGEVDAWGEWTLMGGQMHIFPAMGVGVNATFVYLDRNPIRYVTTPPAPPGEGDVFLNDTDTFILGERLLKLGMIWQWKQHKGSSYAEEMGTYSDAIANAMGFDQPAPTFIGTTPISANARIAYPWPVPTP